MSHEQPIDLRSDTITKPSIRMREAMSRAAVGDDVYGEDETVNRLEARAAEIFDKESALFVPTGTMGNTIALTVHTKHGEEIICDSRSHIVDWELSMMAWFSGCLARMIDTPDGLLTWDLIEPVIRRRGPHHAPTTLVSLENTHNMSGGTIYPVETIDEICKEAHARGLKVHVDGARIFNASVASGVPVARIAQNVDSVMFCLSKGLGAPVGSLLVGRREDIAEGRLLRKRLGGGMRQVGVLGAPGLIALEEGPRRLQEDHENAKLLAHKLAAVPGIDVDPGKVQTNIVIFDISGLGVSTDQFSAELASAGVLAYGIGGTKMRMLTHLDVSKQDCERAGDIVANVAAGLCGTTVC
jgi:threonine aldolase